MFWFQTFLNFINVYYSPVISFKRPAYAKHLCFLFQSLISDSWNTSDVGKFFDYKIILGLESYFVRVIYDNYRKIMVSQIC